MVKQIGGNNAVPSVQNANARMSFLPGWLTGLFSGSTSVSNLVVPKSDPVLTTRNIVNSRVSNVPNVYPYAVIGGGNNKHNAKTRKNTKSRKPVRKRTLKMIPSLR